MTTAAPQPSLGFARVGSPQGTAPHAIALGDRDHRVDRWLQPLLEDFSIAVLEAPRCADPRRYGAPNRSGDWYLADEHGTDPGSFGLALIALERFVLHETSRAPTPPVLLGIGQGATLCLTLAQCQAEELRGVIAIDGQLAELPEGAIEEAPLLGLPILIFEAPEHQHGAPEAPGRSCTHLTDRGGRITLARGTDACDAAHPIEAWLAQLPEQVVTAVDANRHAGHA